MNVTLIVTSSLYIVGLVFSAGIFFQRMKSHEDLDRERFEALKTVCDEIRKDVRELRGSHE